MERLGSARTLRVDVRVLAATNKDLDAAIESGAFREDLYFRLSVLPIRVPPLRDRAGDIPLLVRHFARLFARESNFRPKRFTDAAVERLARQHWRGNVRELRNSVERLMVMAPGDTVDADDVQEVLRVDAPRGGGDRGPPRRGRSVSSRSAASARSSWRSCAIWAGTYRGRRRRSTRRVVISTRSSSSTASVRRLTVEA